MFSGIVGETGVVQETKELPGGGLHLRIRCDDASMQEIEEGDSVAVNGVCLTVTNADHNLLDFDVVPETVRRSNLSTLRNGDRANIEYALRIGDRIGGHLVYGHIDTAAKVLSRTSEGQGERMRVELARDLRPCIGSKAFVTLDGVSLTVASVGDGWFEVALVPETLKRTTLGMRKPGDSVNLEVDPIARYVAIAQGEL